MRKPRAIALGLEQVAQQGVSLRAHDVAMVHPLLRLVLARGQGKERRQPNGDGDDGKPTTAIPFPQSGRLIHVRRRAPGRLRSIEIF